MLIKSNSGNVAGNGGAAIASDITGKAAAYAGGGAGGTQYVPDRALGGGVEIDGVMVRVGGDGSYQNSPYAAGPGQPGTGSGGGAATSAFGTGGSGTVILRIKFQRRMSLTIL